MPVKPHTPLPPLSRGFRSMMPKDLKELLRAFNDHGVKYLVVGGYGSAFTPNREQRRICIFSSAPTKKIARRYFTLSPSTVPLSTA